MIGKNGTIAFGIDGASCHGRTVPFHTYDGKIMFDGRIESLLYERGDMTTRGKGNSIDNVVDLVLGAVSSIVDNLFDPSEPPATTNLSLMITEPLAAPDLAVFKAAV